MKGDMRAVKIRSKYLNDDLYLVFDPTFTDTEGLVVYTPAEIVAMRDKTPAQVRKIHEVKKAFGGGRVLH